MGKVGEVGSKEKGKESVMRGEKEEQRRTRNEAVGPAMWALGQQASAGGLGKKNARADTYRHACARCLATSRSQRTHSSPTGQSQCSLSHFLFLLLFLPCFFPSSQSLPCIVPASFHAPLPIPSSIPFPFASSCVCIDVFRDLFLRRILLRVPLFRRLPAWLPPAPPPAPRRLATSAWRAGTRPRWRVRAR